jgi:hypothetical protein
MYSYIPGVGIKKSIFGTFYSNEALIDGLTQGMGIHVRGQVELTELDKYGNPTALMFDTVPQLGTILKETKTETIQRIYLYYNNGFFYNTELHKKK